jgi:hypothetical protein
MNHSYQNLIIERLVQLFESEFRDLVSSIEFQSFNCNNWPMQEQILAAVSSALETSCVDMISVKTDYELERLSGLDKSFPIIERFDTADTFILLEEHAQVVDLNAEEMYNFTSADRFALEQLYANTGGTSWKLSGHWGSNVSVCNWYGVMCNAQGRVQALELTGNGLIGHIYDEYFPPMLQLLVLEKNSLDGFVPEFLTQENLQHLSLSHNDFTGPLPLFQTLPKLNLIDLGSNRSVNNTI